MKTKYTEPQLIEATKSSTSYRQVLTKLGLAEAGGNYINIKRKIAELDLETAHFHGKAWNKGLKFRPRIPLKLSDVLVPNSSYQSNKLRKLLIREGIFEHKCYRCQLKVRMDRPIPLELDHIDGNNRNNTLENLMLLCPNCHAQTPSFRRRKR